MTRVSENSNAASIKYAINKVKKKMENLQLQGTTLKRISKPSDDPMSCFQGMQLKSVNLDNNQYLRSISYSLSQLNTTEKTLEQLTEIMGKAKDIAIQQSSDFYSGEIRKNVSHELIQLRNQALAMANKRIGNRHIFAGFNTLQTPFNINGEYLGDKSHIQIEIAKDFFIPINLHGEEVFFSDDQVEYPENPLNKFDELPHNKENIERVNPTQNRRELASTDKTPKTDQPDDGYRKRDNIFNQLTTLITALENNDTGVIQDILERIDTSTQRLITMRTRLGSLINTAANTQQMIEAEIVENKGLESNMVDADVADIFSDLIKQQTVLKTAYQTGQSLMSKTLMDFLQ